MPSHHQDSSMHSQQPSSTDSPYAIRSIIPNNSIDSTSSNLNRQRQRLEETAALRRSADVFRRFENSRQSASTSTSTSSDSTINANQAQLERESERLRERERQRFQRERERDDRLLRDISSRAQVEHSNRNHHNNSNSNQNQSTSSSNSRSSGEQQHRVYLLNCKHCDNFLSDRGMKAVLLLKPNITLYSTDSTPANCGPLWTPSRFGPGGGRNPNLNGEKPVERTCECLTQTLGCYGCGAAIGYSILSPCSRCTSSVVKHQRSSNGHRTVLHCSEIEVRERRYVPGEPGVLAAIPPPLPTTSTSSLGIRYNSHPYNNQYSTSNSSRSSSPYSYSTSPSSSSTSFDPDGNIYDSSSSYNINSSQIYLEDLEAEKAEAALAAAQAAAQAQILAAQAQAQAQSNSRSSSSAKKSPRLIRRGDPIYWSDLVPGGERAQPFNPDPILAMPVAGR